MTEVSLSGVPDRCQEHLTVIDGLASAIDAMNEVISVAGPLERIELWRALRERIDEGLDEAFAGARMRGDSWGTIGRAAGGPETGGGRRAHLGTALRRFIRCHAPPTR